MRCYSTKVQEGGLILGDMPGNGLHDMMDALHAHSMPSVKVCGVTHIKEVNLLDELDVEFAGVWCGIAKGRYTLDPHQLTHLTGAPTRILKFILVTVEHSMRFFDKCIQSGRIHGIQLHGFQLPSVVKQLKTAFGQQHKVLKVLHIKGTQCLEDGLIDRYLEAGVDLLVLDRFVAPSRIGSTGIPLEQTFLKTFVDQRIAAKKIMIAGGITENNIGAICRDFQPFGVDIDSGARKDGVIHKDRVAPIMQQLKTRRKRRSEE
jgi:phosphoribosylanthranilate isomerase